jgi:hypothetical protein
MISSHHIPVMDAPPGFFERDDSAFLRVFQAGFDSLADIDLILQVLPGRVIGQPFRQLPDLVFNACSRHEFLFGSGFR